MSITIITICFNNVEDVINTCASVDKQTIKPYEHIIINGSTTTIIEDYFQKNLQHEYRTIFSQPDKGIADAFNIGLSKATGNYIQFLNSGDLLYNEEVIKIVEDSIDKNNGSSWFHGMLQMQRGGQTVTVGKPFNPSLVYRGMRATFHPTMFVKKELFDKYGGFDTNIKIAMDYDFLVRIRNEAFTFVASPIAIFDNNGVSSTQYIASLKDSKQVYEKHCGKSFKLNLWQLRLKFLYYLINTKLGKWLYKIKTILK